MLESVCAGFLDIHKLLEEQGEKERLNDWDAELATQLVNFLAPLRNISVELQAKKTPTLHLVLIRYYDLLEHCVVNTDEDHEEIIIIKERAKELFEEKFKLEDVHYAAAFLNPNTRNLKLLDDTRRARARRAVLEMLRNITEGEESNQQLDIDTNPIDAPPAPKKSRLGRWSEFGDGGSVLGDEVEVDFYLKGKADSEDPSKLLPWWKAKSGMFARLSQLARRVLAIPATSASSDRTFSRAGLIVTEKRVNLGAGRVNDLLVIHNYFLNKRNYAHEQKMFKNKTQVDESENCEGQNCNGEDWEGEDWEEEEWEGENAGDSDGKSEDISSE